MKVKLTKSDKQLIKGLAMYRHEKYWVNTPHVIDIDFLKITGDNDSEHRYLVEQYADDIIRKLQSI